MNIIWKHTGTISDNESFLIKGLNIWDFEWISTGQTIQIKDPIYNRVHLIDVYEIKKNEMTIRFAAGEFSNGVWGIYQEV